MRYLHISEYQSNINLIIFRDSHPNSSQVLRGRLFVGWYRRRSHCSQHLTHSEQLQIFELVLSDLCCCQNSLHDCSSVLPHQAQQFRHQCMVRFLWVLDRSWHQLPTQSLPHHLARQWLALSWFWICSLMFDSDRCWWLLWPIPIHFITHQETDPCFVVVLWDGLVRFRRGRGHSISSNQMGYE